MDDFDHLKQIDMKAIDDLHHTLQKLGHRLDDAHAAPKHGIVWEAFARRCFEAWPHIHSVLLQAQELQRSTGCTFGSILQGEHDIRGGRVVSLDALKAELQESDALPRCAARIDATEQILGACDNLGILGVRVEWEREPLSDCGSLDLGTIDHITVSGVPEGDMVHVMRIVDYALSISCPDDDFPLITIQGQSPDDDHPGPGSKKKS